MNDRIGELFLDQTKYEHMGPPDQKRGVPQPPLHALFRDGKRHSLPAAAGLGLGTLPLRTAVETRRSLRSYAPVPLSLAELSFLLWCSQGVKEESKGQYTLRTVPSAGARHALETLLLVHRVEGLSPGLYQYDAARHGLVQWDAPDDISERVMAACLNQPLVGSSAVTFAWIAERARMTWRYGERGIRYLFLDAGHVCQNLLLGAEAIGAGGCAVAAFSDDDLNRVLELDGKQRFAVYLAAIGKRPA